MTSEFGLIVSFLLITAHLVQPAITALMLISFLLLKTVNKLHPYETVLE